MKTVLSIDGGGIRGLIPALVLDKIEQMTGHPISSLFDLIAGTSTGGILALGLVKDQGDQTPQFSALDLASLYETRGREIFSRSFWKGISSTGGLLDEKYSQAGLESILDEYFQEEPLGAALIPCLLSSYDIQNRVPYFFKSWDRENRSVEMRKVARATSAAPTYFEPALVPVGGAVRALIDGGVFVNNPAMSAYAEARRLFPDEQDILVVSLGTGELIRPIPYKEAKDWGKAEWALPILGVVFDGVSDAVRYQLEQILGNRFFRFQTDLATASDDMDNASKANIEGLKSEANRIIRTQRQNLEDLVKVLGERGGDATPQ
jgi:predicted acylesterase/phospholipase RssA